MGGHLLGFTGGVWAPVRTPPEEGILPDHYLVEENRRLKGELEEQRRAFSQHKEKLQQLRLRVRLTSGVRGGGKRGLRSSIAHGPPGRDGKVVLALPRRQVQISRKLPCVHRVGHVPGQGS